MPISTTATEAETTPDLPPVEVLLVTNHFYPVIAGGAERFRRYGPGLRKRGIHLHVIAPRLDPAQPGHEDLEGVSLHRYAAGGSGPEQLETLLQHAVKWLAECRDSPPHVIQVFTSYPRTAASFWKWRFAGKRCLLVFTMTPDPRIIPSGVLRRIRRRLRLRWCFGAFSRIAVGSTTMAETCAANGNAARRKIVVIPHGTDTERFQPVPHGAAKAVLRKNLGLEPESRVVLHVGSILPRKRPHLLLEAWPEVIRRIPSARLVFLGAREDRKTLLTSALQNEANEYLARIDTLVNSLSDPESVRFLGEVPNVEDYYRSADIFLFCSRQEGMPNAVVEAMACGLPCVLTHFLGFPAEEFGREGSEYLETRGNPRAIADHVVALLENPEESRRLGRNARKWVTSHLNVEDSIDAYARLYRQLAGGTPGTG